MVGPGASRKHIARTLNAAYVDGLLSEDTFSRRLDHLLEARLVDPRPLIGDLQLRSSPHDWRARLASAAAGTISRVRRPRSEATDDPAVLLALDWGGGQDSLLLGRHPECDVVLSGLEVSRRHARLLFRDGHWVLKDLRSTNGTTVNGVRIGRCELRPGDRVMLGDQRLQID